MSDSPTRTEYAVETRAWDVNEGELEALLNQYARAGYELEATVRGGDRKTLFVFAQRETEND